METECQAKQRSRAWQGLGEGLEWAEVLTLPQKAQALGFLDALGMWKPEWLEGLPGLESRTEGGRERGQLKTEPVSGRNEWLPVPQSSSRTPSSLSGSPPL